MDTRKQEAYCRKHLERVKDEQLAARKARQSISAVYHPFDLNTGKKRAPERLKQELTQAYDKLDEIAKKAECTDNQKKRLGKSRGMMDSLIQTLAFFWSVVNGFIQDLRLDIDEAVIFEQILIPIEYLKIVERRKGKQESEVAKKARETLEGSLRQPNSRWQAVSAERQNALKEKALECAQFFQRSSSSVEGRNGCLSLQHHASRQLSPGKLSSSAVLHNFFIERKDKTTAAERFFKQKPRDVFDWLLNRISWPVRPRKEGMRKARKKVDQNVA